MKKKELTYEDYDKVLTHLAAKIRNAQGAHFDSVYPLPRGGYYPAIVLGRELGLPIVTALNQSKQPLIVDDICCTGATLQRFKGYCTAVAYQVTTSPVLPTFIGETIDNETWIEFPDEHGSTIEDNIKRIFEYIGENPNREGLLDTPHRIVKMYGEIFRGYKLEAAPIITVFNNDMHTDQMVIDSGKYYSMCEHHMMPFFGEYWFAYIPHPNGKILGLSKIGRVVDYCAARLQVQERLVNDVIAMLSKALGEENPPLGMALIMRGTHLCKTMRGARKDGTMTASCMTGCFRDDAVCRQEFLTQIDYGRI